MGAKDQKVSQRSWATAHSDCRRVLFPAGPCVPQLDFLFRQTPGPSGQEKKRLHKETRLNAKGMITPKIRDENIRVFLLENRCNALQTSGREEVMSLFDDSDGT